MARIPLKLTNLTNGLVLKSSLLGEPGMVKCENWKIVRAGVLRRRGGFDDWDTAAQDYGRMLGIKRWYREDGGVNLLFVATTTAGAPTIWAYAMNNKTSTSLATITETVDPDGLVLWVDCESVLLVLADQSKGAPWSVRLKEQGNEGGLHLSQLGLVPPPSAPLLTASVIADGTPTNHESRTNLGLSDGEYKYCVTRAYGTKENHFKYGESAPGPVAGLRIDNSAVVQKGKVTIDVLEAFGGTNVVHQFNIYRTLAGGSTFYRVGVITEVGVQTWVDTINDTKVDLSKTLPTLTGLPPKLRCGRWIDDRFYGFGDDGTLYVSAAGQPDVYPAIYQAVIGGKGFRGNGVGLIRDNKFAFKEDGIYLIAGVVPNIASKKISDVRCYARGTVVEMSDSVLFLGDSDQFGAGVYRFDGNSAVRISEQIAEVVSRKDAYFYKKASAVRVGNEYWLSVISQDKRQINHVHPFNNLTLCYDPRYNHWSTLPVQAAAYEAFDGPGDTQEIFMLEADIAAGATGNVFRYNPYKTSAPKTTYPSGSRVYSKSATFYSRLHIGPIITGLEKHVPRKLIVAIRGYNNASPVLDLYDGNTSGDGLNDPQGAEASYLPTGTSAYGTAVYGTGVYGDGSFLNRYEFDLHRTTHEQELVLALELVAGSVGLTPEIEGIEYIFEAPDPEVKGR